LFAPAEPGREVMGAPNRLRGLDVLVDPEQVARVVLPLHLGEAREEDSYAVPGRLIAGRCRFERLAVQCSPAGLP
jgi:hypothetical protein